MPTIKKSKSPISYRLILTETSVLSLTIEASSKDEAVTIAEGYIASISDEEFKRLLKCEKHTCIEPLP